MKINGIIAEYDPFHNGHQYQLEESRRLTEADYTIVVMSGDFVQRGAPALIEKRLRAEMALRCGADLVLELPVLYAASSAEYFAAGAVALLDRLGVVTHLCFGSEWGETAQLEALAEIFLEEPAEYRAALKDCLRQGMSYPNARGKALLALSAALPAMPSGSRQFSCLAQKKDEALSALLSCPNNILGIEYIRALRKRHSSIQPFTVKRTGAGYHDICRDFGGNPACANPGEPAPANPGIAAFSNPGEPAFCSAQALREEKSPFCSAQALRQALRKGENPLLLARYMPREAGGLLLSWLKEKRPLYPNAFSSILYYKLLTEKKYGYEKYLDVPSDLSDRIQNRLKDFTGYEAFCDLLKTKNVTHTRISRCLLHILLDITKEDMALGQSLDYVPYARILGFRKSALPLLGAVKSHSSIPLLSKLADAERLLSPDAALLLRQDIMAADIYNGILYEGTGCASPNAYSTPLVIWYDKPIDGVPF